MKKIFLLKLIAIIFLCMISLIIKSEIKNCKGYCWEATKKTVKYNSVDSNWYDAGSLPYPGFFIKI